MRLWRLGVRVRCQVSGLSSCGCSDSFWPSFRPLSWFWRSPVGCCCSVFVCSAGLSRSVAAFPAGVGGSSRWGRPLLVVVAAGRGGDCEEVEGERDRVVAGVLGGDRGGLQEQAGAVEPFGGGSVHGGPRFWVPVGSLMPWGGKSAVSQGRVRELWVRVLSISVGRWRFMACDLR